MKAPHRLFAKPSSAPSLRRLLACAGAAALLAGCANNPFNEAAVDPNSPVAEDVARMARESREFPTFADIPPIPADQRPLAEWGEAASQLEVARAQLERNAAPNTWTLDGTERFAARARAAAGPNIDAGSSTTPSTEAFARELRERATPPPSPR